MITAIDPTASLFPTFFLSCTFLAFDVSFKPIIELPYSRLNNIENP